MLLYKIRFHSEIGCEFNTIFKTLQENYSFKIFSLHSLIGNAFIVLVENKQLAYCQILFRVLMAILMFSIISLIEKKIVISFKKWNHLFNLNVFKL